MFAKFQRQFRLVAILLLVCLAAYYIPRIACATSGGAPDHVRTSEPWLRSISRLSSFRDRRIATGHFWDGQNTVITSTNHRKSLYRLNER